MNRFHSVVFFTVIIFFISFADAIMSYISPLFIESQVQNTMTMGFIFAFSSIIGIACDLIFPKIFSNRPHFFFLKTTLLSAVLFPIVYLVFPQHLISLLIAMAVWGIYYELNIFSSFHFIHNYVHLNEHAKVWGFLSALSSTAYAIAPIITIKYLSQEFTHSFLAVFFSLAIAIILTLIFKQKFVKKPIVNINLKPQQKTWVTEFKVWKLLFPKVWHLLLLQLLLLMIDASYWTIGALFMVELNEKHQLGSLFLTAHIAPTIIFGFVLGMKAKNTGKKKVALFSSLITGLFLSSYFFINSVPLLLIVTSLAATFLGIALPELKAVFEDYVSRLKNDDNEMIGMQSSSGSLAFVIGPILATTLATFFDYKTAFSIIGLLLSLTAISLLFIVPKKIRLPQKELAKV